MRCFPSKFSIMSSAPECIGRNCYPICAFWLFRQSAHKELKLLQADGWIDRHTRAVFTEFTLFHSQSTLFSSVRLALELTPLGPVSTSFQVASLFLYKYTSTVDYVVLVAEVSVFCLFYFFCF